MRTGTIALVFEVFIGGLLIVLHACARSTVMAARQSCYFRKRATGRQSRASVRSCGPRRSPLCVAHGRHSYGGTPDQLLEVLGESHMYIDNWMCDKRDHSASVSDCWGMEAIQSNHLTIDLLFVYA
jgi:hypothetical protein